MKIDNTDIYPRIADKVLRKVRIPFCDKDLRDQYARPHQFHIYVPDESNGVDEESDDEIKLNSDLATLKAAYKNKRVEKVTERRSGTRGEAIYTVLWKDGTISESVPAEALDDHIDNDLVRHFIYQKDIQKAQKTNVY